MIKLVDINNLVRSGAMNALLNAKLPAAQAYEVLMMHRSIVPHIEAMNKVVSDGGTLDDELLEREAEGVKPLPLTIQQLVGLSQQGTQITAAELHYITPFCKQVESADKAE